MNFQSINTLFRIPKLKQNKRMKEKLLLWMICLLVSMSAAMAQTSALSGSVFSEDDNLPVIGASVQIKGTSLGSVTNADGKFTISNVPASATTLKVTYVGMKTAEVPIKPNMGYFLASDYYLNRLSEDAGDVRWAIMDNDEYWSTTKTSRKGACYKYMLTDLQLDPNGKYAVILGHEVKGVQQEVVNASDGCIELPQYGTKHSLNVSVTAGIVIWEFFRGLSPFQSR